MARGTFPLQRVASVVPSFSRQHHAYGDSFLQDHHHLLFVVQVMPSVPDDISKLEVLRDPDFMNSLMELQQMHEKVEPSLRKAGCMRVLPSDPLAVKVEKSCALGHAAFAANSFLGCPLSEKELF